MAEIRSTGQGLLLNPCLAVAKKNFYLTEEQAEDLYAEVLESYNTLRKSHPDADVKVRFEEIVKDRSLKAQFQAKQAKIAARKNPMKRLARMNKIKLDGLDPGNINHRAFADLVGSTDKKAGSSVRIGESIGTQQDKSFYNLIQQIWHDSGLSKKQFRQYFRVPLFLKKLDGSPTAAAIRRNKLVRDVITEMFGPKGEGYNLDAPKSYTGNEVAFKVAGAIVKAKKNLIVRLQNEGVPIGWLANHVTSQYHDAVRISDFSGKTSDKWVDYIYDKLDHARTFGEDMQFDFDKEGNPVPGVREKKREVLAKIYDNIVKGKRSTIDMLGDAGRSAVGKKSIGNLISQSRVLHFKDPDSWIAYNEKFGHEDPFNGIMRGLQNLSDDTILVENFGTNPDDSYARLKTAMKDIIGEELNSEMLDSAWKQVTGEAYRSVGGKRAITITSITQNLKAFINMSSLGMTIFPSLSDVPYAIGGLRKNGVGFFTAASKQIEFQTKAILRNFSEAEQREILRHLSVGFDGIMGSLHSKTDMADHTWGWTSRLQESFYDLNLLSHWTDSAREGFGMSLSSHLGESLSKGWKSIDKGLRETLEEYGIDESSWSLMQEAGTKKVEGNTFFTPDLLENLPKDRMDVAEIERTMDRLGQYFYQEARNAVIETGKGDRARMNNILGGQPGTVKHAIASLFWLFKGFPVAYLRRVMPRYYHGGMSYWGPQLGALMLTGYVGLSLRELAYGRQPPSVDEPKTYMSAFLYSGAGSYAADLLVNDARKYGRGLAEWVPGPAYTKILKPTEQIFSALVRGEFKDAADRTFEAAYKMIPFNNHFVFRAALDYMILNPVREYLNPGTLRKRERRLAKEGVEYFKATAPSEFRMF